MRDKERVEALDRSFSLLHVPPSNTSPTIAKERAAEVRTKKDKVKKEISLKYRLKSNCAQ